MGLQKVGQRFCYCSGSPYFLSDQSCGWALASSDMQRNVLLWTGFQDVSALNPHPPLQILLISTHSKAWQAGRQAAKTGRQAKPAACGYWLVSSAGEEKFLLIDFGVKISSSFHAVSVGQLHPWWKIPEKLLKTLFWSLRSFLGGFDHDLNKHLSGRDKPHGLSSDLSNFKWALVVGQKFNVATSRIKIQNSNC